MPLTYSQPKNIKLLQKHFLKLLITNLTTRSYIICKDNFIWKITIFLKPKKHLKQEE